MDALRMDQITLYDNGPTSPLPFSDRDDACMKASISSFEILRGSKGNPDFTCTNEPQVVLHLRKFTKTISYVKEDGTSVDYKGDKEFYFLICAVNSVLLNLYSNGCVGKDIVSFQARRGVYLEGKDPEISPPYLIFLNQNIQFPIKTTFKEGIISRSYAYTTERRLCLFLNDTSKEVVDKIEGILIKLFPKHSS